MTRRRFLLDLTMAAGGLAAAALWASRREGRSCDPPPEPKAPMMGAVEVPPAVPSPSPSPTPEDVPLDGDVAY